MDLALALSLVESLAKVADIQYIDLSGGEPLLHPDDVCEIVRHVKACGKQSRLTTNGYWASSPSRAEAMLRSLGAIAEAQRAYVDRLEQHCRAAPYNWFNFFDFWRPA